MSCDDMMVHEHERQVAAWEREHFCVCGHMDEQHVSPSGVETFMDETECWARDEFEDTCECPKFRAKNEES